MSQTENGVTSAPYHHQQLLWLKSSRYRICPRTKRFELFRNLIASFFFNGFEESCAGSVLFYESDGLDALGLSGYQ